MTLHVRSPEDLRQTKWVIVRTGATVDLFVWNMYVDQLYLCLLISVDVWVCRDQKRNQRHYRRCMFTYRPTAFRQFLDHLRQ